MPSPARTVVAAVVLPVVLLALAACTTPNPVPVLTPTATASPSPSPTPRSIPSIAASAQKAVGTGSVASVDDESFGTVWDVRVVLEDGEVQEVHLSPAGKVLAGPSAAPTDADARSTNRGRVAAASVSLATAVQRMLAAVPGGRVTAVALDQYQGRVVWRGDVTDTKSVRHDVRVDAVNGAVLLDRADGQGTSGGS